MKTNESNKIVLKQQQKILDYIISILSSLDSVGKLPKIYSYCNFTYNLCHIDYHKYIKNKKKPQNYNSYQNKLFINTELLCFIVKRCGNSCS